VRATRFVFVGGTVEAKKVLSNRDIDANKNRLYLTREFTSCIASGSEDEGGFRMLLNFWCREGCMWPIILHIEETPDRRLLRELRHGWMNFVRAHNLQAGDEVSVSRLANDSLILEVKGKGPERSCTASTNGPFSAHGNASNATKKRSLGHDRSGPDMAALDEENADPCDGARSTPAKALKGNRSCSCVRQCACGSSKDPGSAYKGASKSLEQSRQGRGSGCQSVQRSVTAAFLTDCDDAGLCESTCSGQVQGAADGALPSCSEPNAVGSNEKAPPARQSSKYRGVCPSRTGSAWVAQIWSHGKLKYLGSFCAEQDAALAWDAEARRLGRKKLNFDDGDTVAVLLDDVSSSDEDGPEPRRSKRPHLSLDLNGPSGDPCIEAHESTAQNLYHQELCAHKHLQPENGGRGGGWRGHVDDDIDV
jgi:hypothetical protein